MFVAGEAGAGKTTLVEAFLGRDCTAQMFVARGQCVEHRGSGEPYVPLLDALGRLCRGVHGARTIELLRREAPSWLLQLPWLLSDEEASVLAARSSSGDRMLRELGMLIERMSEDMPFVLLLEDLHWSDSATLEAIDLLARHTHPARLLIVGTLRPGDGKASRHPVLAAAQELRARGQCELIELPLLGMRETCSMLHQGRYAESVDCAERAIAAAEREPGPYDAGTVLVLVQAHGWMSCGLAFLGRHADALAQSNLAIQLAETQGDDLARASAFAQAAFLRFYRREVEECRRLSSAAEAIGRERRLPFLLACARILLGWCLSIDGAHEEALKEVRAAIRTSTSVGARMEAPLFLAILSECLDRAGDPARALEALDEAFAHVGRSRSFFYVSELYRMSADLLLARGDLDTARTALEQARTIAQEQESPLFASRVATSMERVAAQTA